MYAATPISGEVHSLILSLTDGAGIPARALTAKTFTIPLMVLLVRNPSSVAVDPRHPFRLRGPKCNTIDGGCPGPLCFTLRHSTDCIQSLDGTARDLFTTPSE